jgi:hypothetical protein
MKTNIQHEATKPQRTDGFSSNEKKFLFVSSCLCGGSGFKDEPW